MKTQRKLTPWTAVSLFAVPLSLVVASAAQAQIETPKLPISAQIGYGYITDGSGRDAASNGGLHVGLSYNLPSKSLLSTLHGTPSIDLDVNHATGHGGHIDTLGVTYTERISIGNGVTDVVTHGARPYVGIGVGVFRNDVGRETTTFNSNVISVPTGSSSPGNTQLAQSVNPHAPTPSTTHESSNGWTIGGKILAGVDFGQTFLEASYQISGSRIGSRTDTANLSIGVHF